MTKASRAIHKRALAVRTAMAQPGDHPGQYAPVQFWVAMRDEATRNPAHVSFNSSPGAVVSVPAQQARQIMTKIGHKVKEYFRLL
jgi:hypothetical protein